MTGHHELPDLFGRATLVLSEHAMLRSSVEALRRRRETAVDRSGPPSPELVAAVMDFARQLLAHFAVEERHEYFGALAEESPELVEPIRELTREHREMETLIRDLQTAATTQQFVLRLSQLLERFAAHERKETDLLERFFGADVLPH